MAVSSINGYTLEKALKCKQYLREIGKNKRYFPIEKLVAYHNEIKGTNYSAEGCKPCLANKLYNDLQNYYNFAKMVLINNHLATEDDFNQDKITEVVEEPKVEETVKEEEPKKKIKKEKKNVSN